MSNANDMNGAVDFWAEFKKKKEEEARQREQAARELEMPFDVQQDEIDNLPEPEPDDDLWNPKWYRNRQEMMKKKSYSDGKYKKKSEDDIDEEELIRLVKISARINEKVDEVMKDMAKEFDVPFSQVVRLAIDGTS